MLGLEPRPLAATARRLFSATCGLYRHRAPHRHAPNRWQMLWDRIRTHLAALVREPVMRALNGGRLLSRGRDRHIGRRRQIRRLLIAADAETVTTRQMVEACYPRRSRKPIAHWHWWKVRLSAERYAERVQKPIARPI
jgi:hypothetical protein